MPKVPERELSLGEMLEAKRRAKNVKPKRFTTHYKKIGNLWYILQKSK